MRPPAAPRQPRRGPEPPTAEPQVDAREDRHERPDAVTAPREASAARRWLPGRRQERAHEPGRRGFLERLAEQARARRRLAWRKVLVVVGVVVVLAAGAWAALVSPLLALEVEDVTVSGVGEGTTVAVEDVMARVSEHEGTPLPRLDTGALTEGVTAITTVHSAQVTRSWPNGLTVDVVARVPVAAATSDDGLVLLDADGVVVGSAEEPPEDLPQVTVPLEGERAGETLTAVLTVLAELPEDLRASVATAGATNPASITLELADGAEVRWGSPAESELKASVLAVLRDREASVYDVTVPRSPTVAD